VTGGNGYIASWLAAPTAGFTRTYVARNAGCPLKFDTRRAREELGVGFRPPETTVVEHFQQLLDDGLVKKN
jgi:dihydroflavonol-4-reductase